MDYAGTSQVSVAATATTIFPSRVGQKRIAFAISNYGATDVYLCLSDYQQAAVNYGILLKPNSTFADSSSDFYTCWQGVVTAIDAAGLATLSCWERIQG